MSSSPVEQDGRAEALATLVMAFAADPVERWMYPGSADYLRHFPTFVEAFGGRAFAHGTVWQSGDFGAVALWLPPGVEPDGEAISDVLVKTVSPDKLGDLSAISDQMTDAHPTAPHWYLPWLGVDPVVQGRGLGSRLLAACLEVVDASQLPAYLETPNPRTISFYERHGFEVVGAAVAGTCPPITFMTRPASRGPAISRPAR